MKRVALLCLGLAMGGATVAEAQLTMQMSNGWSFTFGGNVNAFLVYEKPSDNAAPTVTPGGIVGAGGEGATRIRTGLLPAFAVFDAKGKEGNTDLGVHFGFAPQIQCGVAAPGSTIVLHDCFGAQIDMRQVYLTVGGSWGQILAGRELGLFGRQNILTDQTLFGIGATGGQFSGGTTLGRIGFGYIYPQFKAQMTYTTAAGRPFQLSIGLFDPASNPPDYVTIQLPRVEAEGVWSSGNTKVWVGGLVQSNGTGLTPDTKATSWGGTGGVRFGNPTFSLTASGYYGKGIGTTLLYTLGNGTAGTGSGGDDLRTSMGGIGQVTFTPANSKLTVAGSWGISILEDATDDPVPFKTKNWLASGGVYYQATKSLKAVAEFNYAVTGDDVGTTDDNKSIAPAVGLMLFF